MGEAFDITPGFAPAERPVVATLYWDAFGAKLGTVLGPRARSLRFLQEVMSPQHAFCARDSRGQIIGVAGFKTASGALVGGDFGDLWRHYGWIGAVWRHGLLSMLSNDTDNHRFLVDGIFVDPAVRGRGVGTALIVALTAEAARRGHAEIRLDVIDRNTRARDLYRRLGFVQTASTSIGLLRLAFGFQRAFTMTRPVRLPFSADSGP